MTGILDYFYRLLPANPILLRVVESGGKRRRDLFIRCIYLGLLVGLAREEGTTVVLVTHDARVAGYADREVLVRDGRVTNPYATEATR